MSLCLEHHFSLEVKFKGHKTKKRDEIVCSLTVLTDTNV